MSGFLHKFRRDAVGIGYLAAAVFVSLALVSYRPSDPSFNSIGSGVEVANWCGYFGSFLADALYQLWGIGAWALPVVGVRLGLRAFVVSYAVKSPGRGWVALLALIVFSSLVAHHAPESKFFASHVSAGGVVGMAISRGLMAAFNFFGVAIILWGCAAILVVMLTERGVQDLLSAPGPLLKRIMVQVASRFAEMRRRSAEKRRQAAESLGREERSREPIKTEAARGRFALSLIGRKRKAEESETERAVGEAAPVSSDAAVVSDREPSSGPRDESDEGPRRKVRLKAKIERRIENWKLPEISMLQDPPSSRLRVDEREIRLKSELLTDKLAQFSVRGEVRGAKPGPAVTMYEFKPNADVKISKITELADDLSLALSSESVRIIAPIPGRDVVGIETSNASREVVYLKDNLAQDLFWSDKMRLPVALGRQADGEPRVVDLRRMPHLMVAGTTGSGKSVFVVSTITGLLFRHSPKTLRLILIDPKQVDLAAFGRIPHLLMPPIREPKKAVTALKWAIREMDKRYRSMSRFGVRDLEGFNGHVEKFSKTDLENHEKTNEEMEHDSRKLEQYYFTTQPYIVIVVEEFGDLMAVDKGNVEQVVVRLAQMARACGIHLILAMQSPRKDVVTGLIKTNIPGRISFKVASKMDSRIILDDSGAERLLANGDMLYLAPGVAKPLRHHGPWVTEAEITSIMRFWADQGEPQFDPLAMKALDGSGGGFEFGSGDGDGEEDPLGGEGGEEDYDERYDEILAWASNMKEVSASLLQRKFKLGYPRAARMIELFEREGVVGPANGSKPRQVLARSYDKDA